MFGGVVFLLAILVRGFYLYESSENPTFLVPIVDSFRYDTMARDLAAGGKITEEFFWQHLFYPLFLGGVYRLSGSSILFAKIIQMFLGGLTCVMVYLLGSRIFGQVAGVICGVIAALYMPLVFFEGELLAVGWAAFWAVALVLLFVLARQRHSVWVFFALGLCAALAISTRAVFVPFLVMSCLWLAVCFYRRRIHLLEYSKLTAAALAGFLLVSVPVGILSYRVLGRVTILPYSGGINFYIGNNPDYKASIAVRPGLGWRNLTELPLREGITDTGEYNKFFYDKAKEYIRSDPLGFAAGLCSKTVQYASSREIPRNIDVYLFRKWSALLSTGVWKLGGFGFPFGVVLPLAVSGLVFLRRKVPGPVWLFVVFYSGMVILAFVSARYRMPAIPVVAVLAGGGCIAVWQILQARQWRKLGLAAAVMACVVLAGSLPGAFAEEQLNWEAELYFSVGDSLSRYGRIEEAIGPYCKAVELDDDYLEAHNNLGNAYFRLGRLEEAFEQYSEALRIKPDDAVSLNGMGSVCYKQGRLDDAIECYERALVSRPGYPSAMTNLANALAQRGNSKASRHGGGTAARRRAQIYLHLGMWLESRGRIDEAGLAYAEAVVIDSGLTQAADALERLSK